MNSTLARESQTLAWAVMTDEALLLRYRKDGERGAFEELVQRYERDLYRYLRGYIGDQALAEDAFQMTFLQLHLKCGQFDESARLKPWLYAIATHQAIDALRKVRRNRMVSLDCQVGSRGDDDESASLVDVLEGNVAGPQHELQAAERRNWVREAVDKLPTHLKSVVNLVYNQGLMYREVAEILKLPLGTIKSRMHTAMHRLHDSWTRSELSERD